MDKLKETINQYGRWKLLNIYIERIETYKESDFSLAIENMKSLLETIGKQICCENGMEIESTASLPSVLKKSFNAIGYQNNSATIQISSALTTIGRNIAELRNKIGITSHGKTLDELKKRNNKIDNLTKEFLTNTVESISCFLIKSFETKNPRTHIKKQITYPEQEDFNEYWDELYGEFNMGDYSYSSSEILYYVDNEAYLYELKKFSEEK